MTVVEFYDRDSAENITGALIREPDRIVFVGSSEKQIKRSIKIYRAITWDRDLDIEFEVKKIEKKVLSKICDALIEIVEKYDDCIFDLSGGEDLFLVAAGIVHNMYKDRVQLQSFNISNSILTDCVTEDTYDVADMVRLNVEETVRLYGGKIIYKEDSEDSEDGSGEGTSDWNIDQEFSDDIFVMWSICKKDPHLWNKCIHSIGLLDGFCRKQDSLDVIVYPEKAKEVLSDRKDYYHNISGMLSELSRYGLIKHLFYDKDNYSFTYKNEQIRKCLTKAGQLLELFVTSKALELCDDEDELFYNDVMTGVVLDWDGEDLDGDEVSIENEIDVILMKDMVPVFISCKNGSFTIDELYKLSSVANKFGGKHAKKILVATDLARLEQAKYIRARAHDMKIRIIENFHKLPDAELDKIFRSLYIGQ